jgi:hypothetical protein
VRTPVTLITGAGGEIGHGLITRLAASRRPIVTIDLAPLDASLRPLVLREFTGSITDTNLLERVLAEFEIDLIFHLAALLSTRSEFTPITAHQVNVEGTLTLLEFAQREGESHGRNVLFLYPSSVAAYGLPDLATKEKAGRVREDEWNTPRTMYGCNKLYCEQLGTVLREVLQAACRTCDRPRRFPLRAFSRIALGADAASRRYLRLRARDDSCRSARRCLHVLCQARYAYSADGDARCGRRSASTRRGAARYRLMRTAYNVSAFSPRRRRFTTWLSPHFRARPSRGAPTRSGRRSSIRGPGMSTTARRDADWGFTPRYDFASAFRRVPDPRRTTTLQIGPAMEALNTAAEQYVRLVLAMGLHDVDYVDAYYGPAIWKADVDAAKKPLDAIDRDASGVLRDLASSVPSSGDEELIRLRHRYLTRQLEALRARAPLC